MAPGPPPLAIFCRSAACKIAFGAPPESAAASDLGFARDGVQTARGYVSRPVVVPELFQSLRPVAYSGSMEEDERLLTDLRKTVEKQSRAREMP